LRRQADAQSDFQQKVVEREADFNNRLIEVFGTPFPDDIGPMALPVRIHGPDLFHYAYVDRFELTGVVPPSSQVITQQLVNLQVDPKPGR